MERKKDDHWIEEFGLADFLDVPRMVRLNGLEDALIPMFHIAIEGWIGSSKYPFSNWQVEKMDRYGREDVFYTVGGVNLVRIGACRKNLSVDSDTHFSAYWRVIMTEGKAGQGSGGMGDWGVRQLRQTLIDYVDKTDPYDLFREAKAFVDSCDKQFYLPREINWFYGNQKFRDAFAVGGMLSAPGALEPNPGFVFPGDR